MKNRKTFWLGLAAALAFGLVGCDSSSSGEMAEDKAMVFISHLAPEIPSPTDTKVDILVNGATAVEDLEYGQATGRVPLDPGMYTFGIAIAGSTEPVISFDATLSAGDDLTVVAYRDPDTVVDVFIFNNSTDGLMQGKGRLFVGHGADDSLLNPVNVVLTDVPVTECTPLVPNFVFGTIEPADGNLDVDEGTVNVAFDLGDSCPPVEAGPVEDVPVTADVVSILVAVDEQTNDKDLKPELWALIPDVSDIPIRLINTAE